MRHPPAPEASTRPPLVRPSSACPVLDAGTQTFLDVLAESGAPPIHTLGVTAARDAMAGVQAGPVFKHPALIDDLTLPVGPTGSVDVRIIRPRPAAGADPAPLPVVLYLRGGGWVTGDRHTHDRLLRELAALAQVAVVFVDYTPAPEAHFPVQNEQGYAVLEFIAAHARDLDLDATRLAVAGDGVGGMMAAALTLLAKRRRGPEIAFQLLFYPSAAPVALVPEERGSYADFAEGPWLTAAAMRYFMDAEFPTGVPDDATAFPGRAALDQLDDLPPALIITAENDVLRDEGEAYARRLMRAGVAVTATRYIGTIHDFVMLNGLADTPPTRGAMAQAVHSLRDALHG